MKTGDVIEVQCDDILNHAHGFDGTKGVVVRPGCTVGGDPVPGTTVVMLLGLQYEIWFHDINLKVLNADSIISD